MNRIALFCMIVWMTLSVAIVSGQDFRTAMQNLHEKYKDAHDLRITMSIDVFTSRETMQPFYKEKVTIAKRGTSYNHHLSSTDMIMNDKYIVVVDHPSRQITVNERDVKGEAVFNKQTPFSIDSILRLYEDGRYDGRVDDLDKYSVTQKSGEIQQVELYVRHDSGDLRKINYLYRKGQWVTIIFDEFELSPRFNNKEFDEEQFVRKTGKSWQPSAALTGYQVVRLSESEARLVH
jgi:outer membrane lipoprotein-sorting protein